MTSLCQSSGMQLLPFGVLAGGLLTDRYLDRADLTADVEPGVGWEELAAHLAPLGLSCPVAPGRGALVGGLAGTNCSGPPACRHGAFKANILGLEAAAARRDYARMLPEIGAGHAVLKAQGRLVTQRAFAR
jgi:FAD/FMN-containing dehydrogenase